VTLPTSFLDWAAWGVQHAGMIHYAETRPIPTRLEPGTLPFTTDCSGFVTVCAKWAGLPDPNGNHYNGQGYTGTLLEHNRHIPVSEAMPGDLIVYGGFPGHHVVIIEKKVGHDFQCVSHGRESDPRRVMHSVEQRYQPLPANFLRLV
jgi:hypothetical protein